MKLSKYLALLFILPLSNQLYAKTTLESYLEDHEQAFNDLQPHIQTIVATKHRGGDHTWYEYEYPVSAAQPIHEIYLKSYKNLQNLLIVRALGYGIGIGTILAVTNKLLCSDYNDKRILIACLLTATASVLYRNYCLNSVPYFSDSLEQKNIVDIGNLFGYTLFTLLGALGSYYGTHCVFKTFVD
ncbi:MAG TPA: hypothetical protein VFF04_00305 [Candidatus Babeliales bacterium]|nr:hypothetical protein [Candidatus Babeliales bacterium]